MLPIVLLGASVLLSLGGLIGIVGFVLDAMGSRWRRLRWITHPVLAFTCFIVGAILFGVFDTTSKYVAGQGDGTVFAARWAAKWRPGATIECQPRDTDDDGYLSCTVGVSGQDVEAIECGINRWYHGYDITGCRLMKGFSGRQN